MHHWTLLSSTDGCVDGISFNTLLQDLKSTRLPGLVPSSGSFGSEDTIADYQVCVFRSRLRMMRLSRGGGPVLLREASAQRLPA